MTTAIKLWYEDHMETITHYMEQLVAGCWIKGVAATLLVVYIEMFHGNLVVLNVYFAFALADLALGTWYALQVHSWSPKYLLYWVRKLMTYVGLVSLFGGLCLSITLTTGVNLGLVNWLLLLCILTELGSILKNLKRLNIPLHPVFDVMLQLLRKQTSEKLAEKLGVTDEGDKRELEEAIAGGKIKDRRRKTKAIPVKNNASQI